jgi:hypothetical protein
MCLLVCAAMPATGAEPDSETDLVNFAFARYLGTGFYATGDSRIFVLQIPMNYTLKPIDMSSLEPGWMLRLPITIGLVDFENIQDSDIPGLNDVGTLSIIPGIEYQYPVTGNWSLNPFFDLGLAHDFNTDVSVRVFGLGIKSFAYFAHGDNTLLLGNRLLYANENTENIEGSTDFAVFETGLDYRIPSSFLPFGYPLTFSLYYINHYYINDLVFVRVTENPIELTSSNEVGFTVSLPEVSWLPDNPQIGFGIQYTGEVTFYRLVFGMPFF